MIESKLVLVERFDRNFNGAFSVGQDDGFVGNYRTKILADRFFDTILVALLIDDAFALKRPVVALNRHKRTHRFGDLVNWQLTLRGRKFLPLNPVFSYYSSAWFASPGSRAQKISDYLNK